MPEGEDKEIKPKKYLKKQWVKFAKICLKTEVLEISKAQQIPNRIHSKKIMPRNIITKLLKAKDKEKNFENT